MSKKILIAGPCSAESPEQMMQSAAMTSLINDKAILRAGCWKPRTNPGGFEGYGTAALGWLKSAAENYNLDWITECGTAQHAEEILRHDGKLLWIGARTSGDPFAVEEIARTLEGTGVGVWIKNPPQPDLKLWLGAAERMSKRGVQVHGFIHRGFKVWPTSQLRNEPLWSIVRELKKEIGDIPIICDPSHMAGRKELVKKIAIDSGQIGSDGWMIEMHPDVSSAMTDKEQQLSPHELLELWSSLELLSSGDEIQILRYEVDELDVMLWTILRERMKCSSEIGKHKAKQNFDVVQSERMKAVMRNYVRLSSVSGISQNFAKNLFRMIHEASVNLQEKKEVLC